MVGGPSLFLSSAHRLTHRSTYISRSLRVAQSAHSARSDYTGTPAQQEREGENEDEKHVVCQNSVLRENMAAPAKKREVDEATKDNDAEPMSSDDNDDEADDEQQGMEIQVDFEGRNPQDNDFHGIKTLLQQLFLKAHIDLGGLTDIIISQNYVGSVVKQSDDGNASDDDDESDVNDVFGITTVINVSPRQQNPCVVQLRELLEQLVSEHGTDAVNNIVKSVLENDALGLLINERFVNIPAQISVPLLENLISEMERATRKNMPFKFDYYILICKLYKYAEGRSGKKRKNKKNAPTSEEPEILWSNPEEEVLAENAYCSFEFSVEKETDSGLSGNWTEGDDEMVPYRRVLILEAAKLRSSLDEIKNLVS